MITRGMLCWIAATGLLRAGGDSPRVVPVPNDPLELVTGSVQNADSPSSRQAALDLLARARKNYSLQSTGAGYDLKVSFTVNSGGQTQYDGDWQMEDVFAPNLGLRWTASFGAAYNITTISSHGKSYSEGTDSYIPLRLHEARASLFGAIPSNADLARDVIRTSSASFRGTEVTCVLFTGRGNAGSEASGRRWEETEECVDPQSGLLMVHSQVPGRYYAYDYSNAPKLADHVMPRKVTITEAGKTVSEISLQSLKALTDADPSVFVPSDEMKSRGRAVAMSGAQKISWLASNVPANSAAMVRPVCVFGLVTATGELVDAHSLQPADSNSAAAIAAVKQMKFAAPAAGDLATGPRQRFVFVIAKFAGAEQ